MLSITVRNGLGRVIFEQTYASADRNQVRTWVENRLKAEGFIAADERLEFLPATAARTEGAA